MEYQAKSWQRKRIIGMVFGFYTVLTMFIVPRLFFAQNSKEFDAELKTIFFFGLGNYIWALFTFAVFYLGERYPITRPRIIKNLLSHFFFNFIIGAIFFTPFYVLSYTLLRYGTLQLNPPMIFLIFNTFTNSFIYYSGSLAVHQAVFYSRKYQERAFRLQQAELQMLKMQLHPHFFFNTLNAISALVYRSPKEANRMIMQLGDLFRVSFRKDKAEEVPLKEELDFLEAFLQIHQTLMGKRLQIKWDIQPETLDALVPNLILQPLAENAIQHGLAPLEEGGRIMICAERENEKLILQVRDDGQGFVSENRRNNNDGVGLTNTRARLENLYSGEHKFSFYEAANGGVTVKIEIPFREQTARENEY
jgi:two-component system LytT family sensor kinase